MSFLAEQLYEAHTEEKHYEALIGEMTAGPCLVLCLAKENAISAWRAKLGPAVDAAEEEPESIRGRFASGSSSFNPIHAADSPEAFLRERSILFGEDQQAIAVIKPDGIQNVTFPFKVVTPEQGCRSSVSEQIGTTLLLTS